MIKAWLKRAFTYYDGAYIDTSTPPARHIVTYWEQQHYQLRIGRLIISLDWLSNPDVIDYSVMSQADANDLLDDMVGASHD